MEDQKSIIGQKIKRMLQTPLQSGPDVIEGWPWFWAELVAELENGLLIQVNESDWTVFEGPPAVLIPVEFDEDGSTISDVEGKSITDVLEKGDDGDGFAIVLENGLHFNCPGGPGGNTPFFFRPEGED